MGDDWLVDNRAYWDERAPLHTTSDFYAMARFRAGETSLRPFEIAELGDVAGRRLLHLQCHFGQDAGSCPLSTIERRCGGTGSAPW